MPRAGFDHGTGSYWYQVSGRAIIGELTGTVLELLPSITQTWGDWKELHPDTLVLSRQQIVPGDYSYLQDLFRDYDAVIESGDTIFPLSRDKVDKTLRLSDIVLIVGQTPEETVYPLALLGDGVANDVVGNEPVVVFSRAAGPWGRRIPVRWLTESSHSAPQVKPGSMSKPGQRGTSQDGPRTGRYRVRSCAHYQVDAHSGFQSRLLCLTQSYSCLEFSPMRRATANRPTRHSRYYLVARSRVLTVVPR